MSTQPEEPRYGKRVPQKDFDELMKNVGKFEMQEGESLEEFEQRVEERLKEVFPNVTVERMSNKDFKRLSKKGDGTFKSLPVASKITVVLLCGIFYGLLATLLVGAGALLWWVLDTVFG